MGTGSRRLKLVFFAFVFATLCHTEEGGSPASNATAPAAVEGTGPEKNPPGPPVTEAVDLQNEETFIDISDALRSKQYVHRAILNSLVNETNRFAVGRFYLAHMMGFNQIWQRNDAVYAKYSSGLQGLAFGYVSKWGHGLELAGELSSVTNTFLSYKYFLRPSKFSLWGVFGCGVGTEITSVGFAEGPPEEKLYTGARQMAFVSAGFLVPTLDIGFKGEVRINFYGGDRFIFTSGVGVILFL